MTKEEAIKQFDRNKLYVTGKYKTEIQERLFSLGFTREDGSQDVYRGKESFMYLKDGVITFSYTDKDDGALGEYYYHAIDPKVLLAILEGYRPFKDKAECWKEMQKHAPFGWVEVFDDKYKSITEINDSSVGVREAYPWSFNFAFNNVNFIDGSPFGVLEAPNEESQG